MRWRGWKAKIFEDDFGTLVLFLFCWGGDLGIRRGFTVTCGGCAEGELGEGRQHREKDRGFEGSFCFNRALVIFPLLSALPHRNDHSTGIPVLPTTRHPPTPHSLELVVGQVDAELHVGGDAERHRQRPECR